MLNKDELSRIEQDIEFINNEIELIDENTQEGQLLLIRYGNIINEYIKILEESYKKNKIKEIRLKVIH